MVPRGERLRDTSHRTMRSMERRSRVAWAEMPQKLAGLGPVPVRRWAVREVGPFLGRPAANHIRPTAFSAHLRKFRISGLSESRRQQRAISMLSAASENGLKTTPRGDPSSAQAGRIARPSPASTRLIAECTVSTRPTIGMLTWCRRSRAATADEAGSSPGLGRAISGRPCNLLTGTAV